MEMEELDLRQLLRVFNEKKLFIITITLLFLALGIVYSRYLVIPIYESSTTLVLSKQDTSGANATSQEAITQSDVLLNQKLVNTYSEIIKSKKVLKQVMTNLKLKMDETELAESISVVSVKDTEIIKVTVENKNPNIAESIANEIPDVFATEVLNIYNIQNVYTIDTAEISEDPSNISHVKNIGIFGFAGFALASMVVLLIFYFDNTIKSAEDIENYLELNVLTSIPINKEAKKETPKKERKLVSKTAL